MLLGSGISGAVMLYCMSIVQSLTQNNLKDNYLITMNKSILNILYSTQQKISNIRVCRFRNLSAIFHCILLQSYCWRLDLADCIIYWKNSCCYSGQNRHNHICNSCCRGIISSSSTIVNEFIERLLTLYSLFTT